MEREFLIGWMLDRDRADRVRRKAVEVNVRLTDSDAGPVLAISAHSWRGPNPPYNDIEQGGQMQGTLREYVERDKFTYAEGWDKERALRLLAVWDAYHLNDMRAGCEHQRALGWRVVSEYDPQVRALNLAIEKLTGEIEPYRLNALREMRPVDRIGHECPVCGYRFGSAWRYLPLPEDVLDFVAGLTAEEVTV